MAGDGRGHSSNGSDGGEGGRDGGDGGSKGRHDGEGGKDGRRFGDSEDGWRLGVRVAGLMKLQSSRATSRVSLVRLQRQRTVVRKL